MLAGILTTTGTFVWVDGKLLILGGSIRVVGAGQPTVFEYELKLDRWARKAPLATGEELAGTIALGD